jgi:peptidoglycan/xylan/chitin deacetylase (PgdA/CDA1 family)
VREHPKTFIRQFIPVFILAILLGMLTWLMLFKNNATVPEKLPAETATGIASITAQPTAALSFPSAVVATVAPPTATLSPTIEVVASPTPEPAPETLPAIAEELRGLITHGDRAGSKVALTFDVCQAEGELSGYDANIVQILSETNTPATFFLGGEWIRDHPANARELADNPLFQLGNHSWSHADLTSITSDQIEQEIALAQDELYKLNNRRNTLFRLPYGFFNDQVLKIIGDDGLYTIQWEVVSGDPDPNVSAAAMIDWVLQQVQPGSIIIMHANGRGWHTAEALPTIIQSLHDKGFTPVTIAELLNIPGP